MIRIDTRFAEVKAEGRATLIAFITVAEHLGQKM